MTAPSTIVRIAVSGHDPDGLPATLSRTKETAGHGQPTDNKTNQERGGYADFKTGNQWVEPP
ncbi:hypothetical protein DSCO28_62010 [Desulfosarcina ovata subsp. sediminis]|uniref:Uncharacterized protein n=2 Tax=Desulfosarcina ovata TaxID=83564 RepID=A0A5K8AJI8_9BACT|nr:hypothetical protein DSCO28_62010 [Desulfosarcina ovata subsp. sediminis]BBO92676.1 hypothetical protein DSCOOX_58560 [Desulfosarcina ovata subsp. ovata]